MNKPLVSVIIPAYNHENYIQETISSIINQTYENIELIIIDDGSADNTWQKICEMEETCKKRFTNTIFKTKTNEGICPTLNNLIDYAKGEFLFYIASDDIAKPTAIQDEVEFLAKHKDYAIVVGDNEFIDDNGQVCYWDKNLNCIYDKDKASYLTFGKYLQSDKNFKFTSKHFGNYSSLLEGNYIPNGYLVRKSIYDFISPYTKDAPLEDYYLMLQIAKFAKFKYLDKVLLSYRWHANNTIKNKNEIEQYTKNTQIYEEEIIKKLDISKISKDFLPVYKYGICYKRQGIPFVLELFSYSRDNQKVKILKLFNVEIFKFHKTKKQELQ